jgi:hypothetical protein
MWLMLKQWWLYGEMAVYCLSAILFYIFSCSQSICELPFGPVISLDSTSYYYYQNMLWMLCFIEYSDYNSLPVNLSVILSSINCDHRLLAMLLSIYCHLPMFINEEKLEYS